MTNEREQRTFRVYAFLDEEGDSWYNVEGALFKSKGQHVEVEPQNRITLCQEGLEEAANPLRSFSRRQGYHVTMLDVHTNRRLHTSHWQAYAADVLHTPVDAAATIYRFMLDSTRQVVNDWKERTYLNDQHICDDLLAFLDRIHLILDRDGTLENEPKDQVKLVKEVRAYYYKVRDENSTIGLIADLVWDCALSDINFSSLESKWSEFYQGFLDPQDPEFDKKCEDINALLGKNFATVLNKLFVD